MTAVSIRPARPPRPGTVLRPTARGLILLVLTLAAWLLADLTRIQPARTLAAAGLLALTIGAVCILASLVGLHARRTVLDDAVPAGSPTRIRLELARHALISRLPLGRGAVREHLPPVLGGDGDLALRAAMPHLLTVQRRGHHPLGPLSLVVRDPFGLFHVRRTITDDAHVTGLPVVTQIDPSAARAAGIDAGSTRPAPAHSGPGEISPIPRPYASGDDIRRVHWLATARAGKLMTREDEPAAGLSAVIIIDTIRHGAGADPAGRVAVEDRLISHAASLIEALGAHGWDVRVLDAGGDEILHTGRRRASHGIAGVSPLGHEADARTRRTALLALAELAFEDEALPGPADLMDAADLAGAHGTDTPAGPDAPARRVSHDHAAGGSSLAFALGIDDGEPFAGLDLDRFAGRSRQRIAIALRPAEHAPPPQTASLGNWILVRGSVADALSDLLTATADHAAAPR